MATLGQMSVQALISSADSETAGLDEYLMQRRTLNEEEKRWIGAYIGSIRARLIVAEMKAIERNASF